MLARCRRGEGRFPSPSQVSAGLLAAQLLLEDPVDLA
ncbi:hypothetical protein SAMN05421507_104458 [Lentzea jiangxiensis]|uniref:Uncharacterized protein n=1 Tax=Lentzea jiangxiensis TaxID=641025 RepID=A0A1H0NMR2_9PSEU|nr:hypothetical protein SAMN05421507_104458 [Lentzea jiangxiensis]